MLWSLSLRKCPRFRGRLGTTPLSSMDCESTGWNSQTLEGLNFRDHYYAMHILFLFLNLIGCDGCHFTASYCVSSCVDSNCSISSAVTSLSSINPCSTVIQ